jgi:hypothetical protein
MKSFKQFLLETPFKSGTPVSFEYIKNTEKSPNFGNLYGQDIEPAGTYIIERPKSFKPSPRYNEGVMTFENPLVIDFGGGYSDSSNWKRVLQKQFKGKKGKALSKEIVKAGYDGIITMDGNETSEIVDLKMFKDNK